jgi:RNA polymerase sigma-70 factor, ECF subfamily
MQSALELGHALSESGTATPSSVPPSGIRSTARTLTEVNPARVDFESVYAEHFDFVWRLTRSLGVAERDTEDVTQEIFVIVYRKLAEFEGRSSVRTWLFSIARRTIRDHQISASTRASRQSVPVPDDLAHNQDPEALLTAQRDKERLVEVLGGMREDLRELFVLVELEQFSVPEAAEVLSMNVNTTYTRLRAARTQFEALLEGHAQDAPPIREGANED